MARVIVRKLTLRDERRFRNVMVHLHYDAKA